MIAADVQIGGVYLTRVAGDLVPVRVVRRAVIGAGKRGAWVVERVHHHRSGQWLPNGLAPLPKPRTAAALRPLEAS